MSNKDFKAADDLCEWNRAVILPVLDSFDVVDVDNKVFLLPLVVDFRLRSVSARHVDGVKIRSCRINS